MAMRYSKQDNANLSEVKAVLERLQRISRDPSGGVRQAADDDGHARHHAPQAAGRAGEESESGRAGSSDIATSGRPANVRGRRYIGAVAVMATLLAAIAGGYIFLGPAGQTGSTAQSPNAAAKDSTVADAGSAMVRSADPSPTRPASLGSDTPNVQAVLQAASGLMASGRIQAARTELRRMAQEGSADVAWALARSYDPNFLGTISTADSIPDVAEATRWYRIWYEIAVKQGLVADSVSLERIIRSMH